jgi:hypothetical protein
MWVEGRSTEVYLFNGSLLWNSDQQEPDSYYLHFEPKKRILTTPWYDFCLNWCRTWVYAYNWTWNIQRVRSWSQPHVIWACYTKVPRGSQNRLDEAGRLDT